MSKEKTKRPIVFGHSHAGTALGASPNDDRHFEGTITTQGGLDITLLVVSDGEGALGAQAAQQTVKSIVEICQTATIKEPTTREIIAMLGQAIGEANQRVYGLAQAEQTPESMMATAAVAAIAAGRLFIANVGHSRIYLVRKSKVIQLTVDHSWAEHWVKTGELNRQQARRQPDAQRLTRAIGQNATIQVDFGLYLQTGQEGGERAFQQQGLNLEASDIILVISDGLTHPVPGKQIDYVSSDEIKDVVERSTAEQAAKTLVDLAVGRNVDDNATAVVAEMPGRPRPSLISPRLRVGIAAAVAISALLCILFGILLVIVPSLAPSAPVPTPTPGYAYISSGSLLFRSASGETVPRTAGESVTFGEGSTVIVADADTILDLPGNYRLRIAGTVEDQSRVALLQAGSPGAQSQTIVRLQAGSLFVIAAGGADTNIELIVQSDAGSARVSGATMMGIHIADQQLIVDCFVGVCGLESSEGVAGQLVVGQRGFLRVGEVPAIGGAVVPDDYFLYPPEFIQSLPVP